MAEESAPKATTTVSPWRSVWRGWIRPFLIVALVVLGFRSSILDWNHVPTGSMNPTIVEGDYILVNRLAYNVRVPWFGWSLMTRGSPERGDIIVFVPPGQTERYVKRIIGVPGDVIEMIDNQLVINGEVAGYRLTGNDLVEMVSGQSRRLRVSRNGSERSTFGPITVPAGSYFVMGDNRDNSLDSRYFGFVDREAVLGKAFGIGGSLDPFDHRLPRWERFFSRLV